VLLPALGAARASARRLQSLSNMRQLAIGWSVYTHDAQGIAPPGQPGRYNDESANLYDVGNGDHYRPRWFAMMGAKNGIHAYSTPSDDPADEHSLPVDNPVMLCPVVPDWTSTRNFAYGYNYQFLGNARFRNNDESQGFINFPVKAAKIRGSLTVMFASNLGTCAGKPESARTPNLPDGSRHPQLTALGGHGYALDPPRLVPGSDYADRMNRAPEHRSAPDPRYAGGKANVVFCDGHADSMTLEDMGYVVNEDGSVAAEDERASNRLFSGTGRDTDPPIAESGDPG
jgi:prepilin-type processing-associated H-X9-DG protein